MQTNFADIPSAIRSLKITIYVIGYPIWRNSVYRLHDPQVTGGSNPEAKRGCNIFDCEFREFQMFICTITAGGAFVFIHH